jgi:hypothetical protein
MGLRGVVRGRTIELEADPHLPDGTQVEVEVRPCPTDTLFEHLYALWQLTSTEPLLFLDEACQPAAQALAPQKASYFIQAMGQK